MVKDKINRIDNEEGEKVFYLLYNGDGYSGHYSALDQQLHSTKLDLKSLDDLTKILTYKCARNSSILRFNPFSIGEISERCQYCSANYFKVEKNSKGHYTLCCSDGKIKVPLGDMPNEMIQLFTGKGDAAKNFRENIRQYNNALSFVSFGAKVTPSPGYGLYCFKIQGMVHHRVSPLYHENEKDSAYGQLYI